MGSVIGDTVEHGLIVGELAARHQALKVDPANDAAGGGRDAGDAVSVPNVGVDFAVDVFEFVEFRYRLAIVS